MKALSECGTYAGHIAGADFAVVLVDHSNWSFDIGQAAAYLQLAAWDLGVSSCIAYFGLQDKLKDLLGIPPGAAWRSEFPLAIPPKSRAVYKIRAQAAGRYFEEGTLVNRSYENLNLVPALKSVWQIVAVRNSQA